MSEYKNDDTESILAEDVNSYRDIEIRGYEDGVRKVRNALFWSAGIIALEHIIAFFQLGEINNIILIQGLIIVGAFVGLGFYTQKKPYTANILGLTVFILWWLYLIVINVLIGSGEILSAIFGGIIFKIIILTILIKNLSDAKELQAIKNEDPYI